MKELFMDAHNQLIDEYMEAHPDADESVAYEATADLAYNRMIENIARIADEIKDRRKYEK